MNRITRRKLIVDAVKYVFRVALVVHDGEFRRVEKASGVQAGRGDEVSPVLAAVTEIHTQIRSSEGPVRGRDAAVGSGHALAGARGDVEHDAGLVTVFGGGRAGDDFHRLDRVGGNLVGELLAELVGDGLAVERDGILRVI